MPRVLGIDQSLTATGLCRVDLLDHSVPAPGEPYTGVIDVCTVSAPKGKTMTKREYSRRVTALVDQIEGALDGVDLVAMEDLAYGAKGASAWILPWLYGRIIDLCEKHDKRLIVVNVTTVKKYATGSGNAGKDVVMLAVAKRWPGLVANNNEADSVICAAVGCRYLGLPIDNVPKENQKFMDKISE